MKTFEEYINEQNIFQRGLDFVKSKLGMQTSQQKADQKYADKTNPVLQAQQYIKSTNETIAELKDIVLNCTRLLNNAGRAGSQWQKSMEPRIQEIQKYILAVLNVVGQNPPKA